MTRINKGSAVGWEQHERSFRESSKEQLKYVKREGVEELQAQTNLFVAV
jgi:hypothetical protein